MNPLRKAVNKYLQERQALGFKTQKPSLYLSQFIDFLEEQQSAFITKKLSLRWATLPANGSPSHWASRLSVVRQFARYHSAIDSRTEIPPQGLLPCKYRRAIPYIYTEKQVLRLIQSAKKLNSETGLRASTYTAFFGLIAITGMRISEVINLDRADVDLVKGILIVRKTKLDRTQLSLAGVTPRVAQAAMRHSSLNLTMNIYTDPTLLDVAGAVNALPTFSVAAPAKTAL